MFWHAVFATSLLKLLEANHLHLSYDAHVHEGWLALTNNLPVKRWYTDSSTRFPLDYMPLFGWCEWFLSQFAPYFDPHMLKMGKQCSDCGWTKLFLLWSAVALDMSMAYGIGICSKALNLDERSKGRLAFFMFTNAGQYYLDYMFFHYSGLFIGHTVGFLRVHVNGQIFQVGCSFCFGD